jgi:hypothetical protein
MRIAVTPKPPVRVPEKDAFFRAVAKSTCYSSLSDQSLPGDEYMLYLSRPVHSTRPPVGSVNTVVIL